MDHQPPPFFKRGPAPLARLFFYVTLSLVLIVIDARFHTLDLARQSLSLITDPLQRAAQMPCWFRHALISLALHVCKKKISG